MSVTEPFIVDGKRGRGFTNVNSRAEKFGYKWTIHNFSQYRFRFDGSYLFSPTFQTLWNGIIIRWHLGIGLGLGLVGPSRDQSSSIPTENFYYVVRGRACEECKIVGKVEFSIINENVEKSIKAKGTINALCKDEMDFSVKSGNHCITNRENLIAKDSGFCPSDKLTIVCDIMLGADQLNVSHKRDSNYQQVPDCQMVDDISALFGDKKFCDVKLTVNGVDFHAHKNILAARSSVFAAMFEHEMKENINNTVNVTDINHEIFEEVLRYIYTGTISSVTHEMAIELLVAADKYELNRLKIICEVLIGKGLTKDNVSDVMIVADAHRSTLLKTQAIEYISAHMKDVTNTDGYKSMRESHPQCIEECCIALAEKLEEIEMSFSQ